MERWEGPSKGEWMMRWVWRYGDGQLPVPKNFLSHQFSKVRDPWNKAYLTHAGMDLGKNKDYDGRGDGMEFGQGPS